MGKKKSFIAFLLIFFVHGCAKPPSSIPPAPYKEAPPQSVKRIKRLPKPSPALRVRVVLPEYKNPRDGSEMVLIPKGSFSLYLGQSINGKVAGQLKQMELAKFYMDKWEITQEQFGLFLKSQPPGKRPEDVGNCPKCPISHISFTLASSYCKWAGKRLPSEVEWLVAAQGMETKPWPWGESYEPQRANFLEEKDGYPGISPAGSFPSGASFYGSHDMSGNVWEWVSPPYLPISGADKKIDPGSALLKGGSWRNLPGKIDLFYRHVVQKNLALENFGFRCAKSG